MKFQFNNLQLKIGENMAKDVNEKKKEKRNPILWLLFAVVIPFIIFSVIVVSVLSLVGVDVSGWVKEKGSNVPVVSSFITTEEEEEFQNQLDKANETIAMQSEEIEELTKEIESLEAIREELELEIKRLENKNRSEDELVTDSNAGNENQTNQAAASFRKMDPESAAQIIQNLDQSSAVEILANLSGNVRGDILAEMEPNRAAEILKELMNE